MTEIVQKISSDLIDDPAHAMRTELDRDALWELADNIKQNGLINPITVRPKNGRYEVVAGHRRFSACKINGMVLVPCVVRELNDAETFAVMAAENLERADVDPVDEAIFINQYIEQTKQSVPEVAKVLRRSVQYVETRLAVGKMPDYMQQFIKSGELKLGAALKLFEIDNDTIRRTWVEMAVRDGVSVAQADYWVQGYKMQQLPNGVQSDTPPAGFEPDAPRPVEFRCAIDGKLYDARLCKTLIVAEENLSVFNSIVTELRKDPAQN